MSRIASRKNNKAGWSVALEGEAFDMCIDPFSNINADTIHPSAQ